MGLSFGHILVVLVLVLILFGAGKLPSVFRDLGKAMRAMKEEMNAGEAPKALAKEEAPHDSTTPKA